MKNIALLFLCLAFVGIILVDAQTTVQKVFSDDIWVYDTVTYSGISVIVEVPYKQKMLKHRQSFADDDCRGVFYVIEMPIFSNTKPIGIDSVSILNIIDGPMCGACGRYGTYETDSLIAKYNKGDRKITIWKRNNRFHRQDHYYSLRVYCQNFKSLERLNEIMDKIVIFKKRNEDE